MSSLVNGAPPTSIDTQLPTSTTFHNASSISNKPSDTLPLSSISTIPSSPVKDPLTSSEVALDVAPNTTQTTPTPRPSTTASDSITKETAGNLPTRSISTGRSLTAEDDTPKTTSPAPTSDGSQIIPSTSPTSTTPTSSLIPTQIPSSATEAISQPVTATTVSSAAVVTATSSTPILSSTPSSSQSQNQTPTPQPSSPRVSPTSGIQIGKDASSFAPVPPPSSTSSSQATSAAAQPTDNFVQGPQIFSAAAVAPSFQSSTLTSTSITSSAVSTQGQSQVAPSQPTNPVVSAPGDVAAPNQQSPSPASTPLSIPSAASPSAASVSIPISVSDSTPISKPSVVVGNSVLSETPFNTIVPITSPTPNSTGGVGTFPTAINSLPGDLRESGLPGGSQPTGQPIADPVGSSSKPSTATIVGGTVGGIAAAAFIVVLLWLWRRKVAGGWAHRSIEKDSFRPMTQKVGISTTVGAVGQNLGKKFASRNVNMDRGNPQFLESVTVEPTSPMPTQNGAQNPATDRRKPKARKLGLSFDHGRLFNPFSDANALMSGSVPPPSSSILSNPFADDNMVLPPPVSAATRRSRGRSLGGIRSFQAPAVAPRPHSVHRESLQSNDSFLQRRDKFRSDPFDLELESRLVSPENGVPSRSSSVYSNQLRVQQNNRDSYTSRYVSGSSLGDWTDPGPDTGSERAAGRRDSPTLS
ncbi:sugar transporter [Trichoderma arundinaceum]|uniref:Sugar transporter n=1 Tax=Trichoderma arundinaceum TaxID=490622 RepID=A0A395NB37_TRIAR|nr:sugar transporter [Trichoderma arundinaceum]